MPPSSGKKKQQPKLAGLSRVLHLSPADSTAAATAACSVREAVEELMPPGEEGCTISKSALAAAVPYVGVLLQAVGWLARARIQQEHPDEVREASDVAITAALTLAAKLLPDHDKVKLEHLRPALRPCPEDGVTPEAVYILTQLADGLVFALPWEDSSWVNIARVVARTWCCFIEACFLFHSRKSAPAALLLTRPLLQLVEAIAQQTEDPIAKQDPAIQLLGPPVATFDVAQNASDHPGLRCWLPSRSSSSLSAEQAEVCGANIQAALQQQDLWWRSLAVQVTFLSEVTAAGQVPPWPLEPERFCPDYGAGYAWPRVVWRAEQEIAMKVANRALDVLVMAEVWWLWPWQLEVIKAAAARAAAAAEADETSSSSSSRNKSGDGSGHSSSSSSSSRDTQTQAYMLRKGVGFWEGDKQMFSGIIPYPLTPALVAPGCVPPPQCPLPPVTRQQLQLVLGLLVNTGGRTFSTAAVLLVLLLQRADPGLRAAFLNGPEASLLLTTLVTWGCHPKEWGVHEVPSLMGTTGRDTSWEDAVQAALDLLQHTDVSVACFSHPASAALVLAYCYLEPAAPRHLDGQQQPALVATPIGASAVHTGSEEVATVPVPACDLRLAQGVVPTPQLVGTLEALARVIDPMSLNWVKAVVSACCRALMQPHDAAGSSQSSSSSSGNGGGGGSSDSSSGSNTSGGHSSSSTCGDLRAGVLQALASMAVMLAAAVNKKPPEEVIGDPMLLAHSRLTNSASMAADLLRLAAHEVAAGRAGRATLALATAAQQLSWACAKEAPAVLQRLVGIAECQEGGVTHQIQITSDLVEHASGIAYHLQQVLDAVAALRTAVEGWQQRTASNVDGNPSTCDVPSDAARSKQAQQVGGQQLSRYRQVMQQLGQAQQQLQRQRRREKDKMEQRISRTQRGLQQQQDLLKQQQEDGQSGVGQQTLQQYINLLQQQLLDEEQEQAQQQQVHFGLILEQQQSAVRSLQSAVHELAGDVHKVSNTSLQLAGCSWAGCRQQHKARYSADAAVAGLRGVRCGGCGLVRYCCPQHQQADWKRHGPVCRRLAQARGAAGVSHQA